MKILHLLLASILLASIVGCANGDSTKLRYGYGYNFNHKFNNGTDTRVGIERIQVTFTEDAEFNGGDNPEFPWDTTLSDNKFIINAMQKRVPLVESTPLYVIKYYPAIRHDENIVISYRTTYYLEKKGEWVGPKYETNVAAYEITRCGDGILDRYIDPSGEEIYEQCEINDQSHTDWGTKGCSVTCIPVN